MKEANEKERKRRNDQESEKEKANKRHPHIQSKWAKKRYGEEIEVFAIVAIELWKTEIQFGYFCWNYKLNTEWNAHFIFWEIAVRPVEAEDVA